MERSAISLVKKIYVTISRSFSDFFLVHALYAALGFVLFAPLMGALGQLIINISSRPVLADTDILFFLLSPYGIAAALIFGALLTTIVIFELSSLMFLYGAGSSGHTTDIFQAAAFTAARSLRIYQFSLHVIVRLALIVLPFIGVAAGIAWLSLSDYDINYYLSVRPPEFWFAGSAIALIMVCMLILLIIKLLGWALALPLVLFRDCAPGQSFAASSSLTKTGKMKSGAVLISWGLTSSVISGIIFSIVSLLGSHILPLFYHSMNLLILAIGAVVMLWSVVNFFVTALFSASFSGILVELLTISDRPIDGERYGSPRPAGRPLLTRSRLLAAALIGIVAAVVIGFSLLDNIRAKDDLIIIAHRGAAGKAPENTMASINQAIDDAADWVEIDVQESSDGHVVVIHDSDFMKLAQTNLKVWEGTLEQIQAIDIGSWFSPDFSDERVPLLIDVLNASKGKARVVIELKYYGHDQQLEQRVVDIVEQVEMVDDTAIMSLKYDGILKVRALRPDWTVGLLSATALGDMRRLDADFLAVNTAMATPGFIRTNQEAGKKVLVWTVNDRMTMFSMMSSGVDGIITDEPALARQVIAERAELNSLERLLVQAAIALGKDLPRKIYRDNSP